MQAMARLRSRATSSHNRIGQGADIAVALSISHSIDSDVLTHIRRENLPVERLIVYSPAGGASRESVPSTGAGLGLAAAISAALRADTAQHRESLHLFQAGPLPLAIFVGHLWNRMPRTQ